MGGGAYSFVSRSNTAKKMDYTSVTAATLDRTFEQNKKRTIHKTLDPKGVNVRESRDSDDHPNSLAIIIGLDVTGSMGEIPALLVRDGIPRIIQRIFERGIADPQVAFVGIGDHEVDRFPLQIGQFESSDQLLDESLTNAYIEGGGGGNAGESYLLSWYHAAFHTSIDCFEKRGQKGILITIGDEPCLSQIPGSKLAALYGLQSEKDYTAAELLALAAEKYDVYHLNMPTFSGSKKSTLDYWRQLLGANFVETQSYEQVPEIIGDLVSKSYNGDRVEVETDLNQVSGSETPSENSTDDPVML